MNARNTRRLRLWQQKWRFLFGQYPDYLQHCRDMGRPIRWPIQGRIERVGP